MMDTATIKTLERMWIQMGRGRFSTPEERQALAKGILYIRTMGEIEAAATSMQIVFEDVGILRKDYGRTDFRAEKFNGNDNSTFSDHASLADAWGRIKEQK